MPRNSELYKGRKHRRSWPRVLLIILVAVIAVGAMLFYGLQKYLVYTPDGVKLELPILAKESPAVPDESGAPSSQGGSGSLVMYKADYTTVTATAGNDLSAVKAIYVPYTAISADGVAGYAAKLSKGNALVLQLKPASGQLAWKSSVDEAENYGVNGSADLKAIVSAVKEKDVWLVAELNCCVDSLMAERNTAAALKTASGAAYTDGEGGWIDPYSADMRSYIVSLARELISMGFDEILLSNVVHPAAAPSGLSYASSAGQEVTAESAVSSYALSVTRALSGQGAVVSVVGTRDALSEKSGNTNGQNSEFLLKIFDRIYCYTDAASYAPYKADCDKYVTIGDKAMRFVPMCAGTLPATDCWVLLDSAK